MMDTHSKAAHNPGQKLFLRLALGLFGLSLVGVPGFAHAIGCGDHIGPGGFVRLDSDLFCAESPALITESPALITIEGPVTVDLNGFTIACPRARDKDGNIVPALVGTGIEVIGSRARIRNATIENCDRGVIVSGDGKHLLTRLTVKSPDVTDDPDNTYIDGIAFHGLSARNRFFRNRIVQYAGEGFRLDNDSANRNVLSLNVVTEGTNHAFRVSRGQNNLFLANVARNNTGPNGGKVQGEGFRSQDRGTRFIGNIATGNGDEGFRLRDETATQNLLIGNIAKDNGLKPCNPFPPDEDANPGIAITEGGRNNKIINNTVEGNCLGIVVEFGSLGNRILNNTASDNGNPDVPLGSPFPLDLFVVDMLDGNPNCDANKWRNNEFDPDASAVGPPPFFNEDPGCIQ